MSEKPVTVEIEVKLVKTIRFFEGRRLMKQYKDEEPIKKKVFSMEEFQRLAQLVDESNEA
ncbi:MAG: hypothetical protein HQL37_08685 [Alphaproteobacteria bacterium]|nr:hypothetical protein [Alphaproteobacteria bacterium]